MGILLTHCQVDYFSLLFPLPVKSKFPNLIQHNNKRFSRNSVYNINNKENINREIGGKAKNANNERYYIILYEFPYRTTIFVIHNKFQHSDHCKILLISNT